MISVIEDVDVNGTKWGLSFTSNNPESKDYFRMTDKETAFRLEKYLNEIFNENN